MTNDGKTHYLINNEDRTLVYQTTDSAYDILFRKDVFKVYVNYTNHNLRHCVDQPW